MSTLARSMLRNRTEADDVVAEALVRIQRAGPGFRGERGLKTWTLRIVANLCRDRLRRRKFDGGSVDDLSPLEHAGLRVNPVEGWDESLDRQVMVEALERAMARLPAEQREVLVLRFRTGLSIAEIVDTLGIPEGTVKSRLGRGLAALRVDLKETLR
jgi:RNA polymerase sigma-70 factor (ECF subfamily)